MTATQSPSTAAALPQAPASRPAVWATGGAALVVLALAVVAVGSWHLTQGTSGVGTADLFRLLTSALTGQETGDDAAVRAVLVGSRLPRLAAGVAVGFALGVAGALFQSIARNALASPDTLAVTAGSYVAVVAVAAFGIAVPLWASGAVAFAGGIVAAGLVLGLAGGAGSSSTRLVLAGSAVAMALQAAASALLILFQAETTGLFAWGSGSLSQLDLTAFWRALPVVLLATLGGSSSRGASTCSAWGTTPPGRSASPCARPARSACCWPCCSPRPPSPSRGRSASWASPRPSSHGCSPAWCPRCTGTRSSCPRRACSARSSWCSPTPSCAP
nr:hypothetical protein GCM10025730_51230 [Promicromonospora thailandica]